MMSRYRAVRCLCLLSFAAASAVAAETPAPPAAAKVRVATFAGTTSGAGIRIAPDLVIAAIGGDKGQAITLVVPPRPVPPRKGAAKTPDAAPAGQILAADPAGVVVARLPVAVLDGAGLSITPVAAAAAGFGDAATILSATGAEPSAMLEADRRFFVLPRDTVSVSGTQPVGGAGLLNGCDQLIGMMAARGSTATHGVAIPLGGVRALLDKADVTVDPADATCKATGDGLARLSDRADADAQAARNRAVALDGEIAALERAIAAGRFGQGGRAGATTRLATLKRDAAGMRATADRASRTAERIDDYRMRHDRALVIAILLLVVALTTILVAIVLARRTRGQIRDREESIAILAQRQSAVDGRIAARPWRDVVLQGPAGLLKIGAQQLAEGGDGAVIGRSETSADVTFSPPDISRRHARLFVRDDVLWIVDLGSAGGTFVNGRRVDAAAPVSLRGADEVRLSDHSFTVRIA